MLTGGALRDGRLVACSELHVPLEQQVRRISTYNAESNRPMVAVNEALGFRRAGGLSTLSRRW